jgi:hypothetical protein
MIGQNLCSRLNHQTHLRLPRFEKNHVARAWYVAELVGMSLWPEGFHIVQAIA